MTIVVTTWPPWPPLPSRVLWSSHGDQGAGRGDDQLRWLLDTLGALEGGHRRLHGPRREGTGLIQAPMR